MVFWYELIIKATVTLSALLALLILLKFHKLNYLLKIVGIFIIVGASIDIVSTALYYEQQNNLKFLHLYTLFEFVIVSFLFKNLFARYQSRVKILYPAIIATILILINTLIIQDINSLNSYSSVLSSTLILAYCIHFFILILEPRETDLSFTTLKWFVICLFIYHSTSLIVMFFGGVLFDISREAVTYIWSFRSIIILSTKIILTYFFVKLLFFTRNLIPNE